jgi:DNA-binding MarR family transcriptional regulator
VTRDEDTSPSVFFEMYALGGSIRELLATAMAKSPLRPDEYALYSAIFEDERITPTRLARRQGVPLTTAMDQIARLERRGHARRIADPRDGRARLVTLTANGLAAHRAANAHFEAAYAAFADALPIPEESATRTLRAIRGAVESARESLSRGVGEQPGKRRIAVVG